MIYRNAIILITLAVSSNAFWWGNGREDEPVPTVKQVPVGYFRAFTYHPLGFNPQAPNQYFSYPGGKMIQPPSVNSWKGLPLPPGPPSTTYGQNMPPSPSTQNVPSPITPTNAVPTQTQSQTSSAQPSTYSAAVSPTTSTTATQSQPLNDIQPPTTVPAQFSTNPHLVNNGPMRVPYIPDPVNLQYITNVAPVPLQQVQFVPCMCPVAISISSGMTPDVIANKRSDDIPMPPDYRDTSIGEMPLSEDR